MTESRNGDADERFIRVAASDELREGAPMVREVFETEVLLIRTGGTVRAYGHRCTHLGAPLSEGVCANGVLVCPWHNARFDLETGVMLSPPALDDLPRYRVREENGEILLGSPGPRPETKPWGKDEKTIVILGAGAAGEAAAETLRREGFGGVIAMVSSETDLPYDRTMLSKGYMTGDKTDQDLALRTAGFYERLGITLMTGRTVTKVLPAEHTVRFQDGKPLRYSKLLIATGGEPVVPEVPGVALPGVLTLRSLGDARLLRERLVRASSVVLIGAGFIGLELASAFAESGCAVTVVARNRTPLERSLGPAVGDRIRALHEEHGVRFVVSPGVSAFSGTDRLEAVELESGERIPAELAVIGIGVRPRVGFLSGTKIAKDGAVPVDGDFHTAEKDVYAAGDIALVPDPRTGVPVRIEHWAVAERQGRQAARSMLGIKDQTPDMPFFWTNQHGVALRYVGHGAGYDSVLFRGEVERGPFIAGYYRSGTLLAAATIGMERELAALGELLRLGRPVTMSAFIDESFNFVEYLTASEIR